MDEVLRARRDQRICILALHSPGGSWSGELSSSSIARRSTLLAIGRKNLNFQRTAEASASGGAVAAFRPGPTTARTNLLIWSGLGSTDELLALTVELIGIEPTTSGLQSPRSPS
jgi:hypothetical protein